VKAHPVERVLIAVDNSIESLEAARTGAHIAAGWGARVRVINVIADGPINAAIEEAGGPGSRARRRQEAQQLLDHVVNEVRSSGVAGERVDAVIREGQPFRRILEEANAWPAGLIVMTVSDRTGLRPAYIGSETEHVVEFAECPVLVVPAARTKREGSAASTG
jgi:nucleotide-binding universal stress UspA family protein